jgi:hypothetical protein
MPIQLEIAECSAITNDDVDRWIALYETEEEA